MAIKPPPMKGAGSSVGVERVVLPHRFITFCGRSADELQLIVLPEQGVEVALFVLQQLADTFFTGFHVSAFASIDVRDTTFRHRGHRVFGDGRR